MSAEESVVKVCALLGFYAVWNGSFLLTFRYNLSGNIFKVQARVLLTVWNSSLEIVEISRRKLFFSFSRVLVFVLYTLSFKMSNK